MASLKISKNVQILCKSTFKSVRKTFVKLCANHKKFVQPVQNPIFPPTFTNFPTIFPTIISPHKFHPLFHFFTTPTITTINKLEERK